MGVHSKIDSHRKNTFQSIFYPQRYQCDRVQMDITETLCLDTVYLCPLIIFLFKSWANCMYKTRMETSLISVWNKTGANYLRWKKTDRITKFSCFYLIFVEPVLQHILSSLMRLLGQIYPSFLPWIKDTIFLVKKEHFFKMNIFLLFYTELSSGGGRYSLKWPRLFSPLNE